MINQFSSTDLRKQNWITSNQSEGVTYYYPYKYKLYYTGLPAEEYPVLLRLAEQYLIRAEAVAQQNDLNGGISDLNIIRNRAGLADTSLNTQQALLNAIYHEKVRIFNRKRAPVV